MKWASTYFVDIVHLDDVIKEAVEVIEEVYHLHSGADGAHGGEANDIREEDGHYVVATWLHCLPCHQLICNVPLTNEMTAQIR